MKRKAEEMDDVDLEGERKEMVKRLLTEEKLARQRKEHAKTVDRLQRENLQQKLELLDFKKQQSEAESKIAGMQQELSKLKSRALVKTKQPPPQVDAEFEAMRERLQAAEQANVALQNENDALRQRTEAAADLVQDQGVADAATAALEHVIESNDEAIRLNKQITADAELDIAEDELTIALNKKLVAES
jgi:hypothetical protein